MATTRLNQYGTLQSNQFDEVTPTTSVKVGVTQTGTFYASEFIENIGSLTANIYSAYDPLTGEVAQPLYGPGQGTYMRYTMDNKCIVYNEIDEVTPTV